MVPVSNEKEGKLNSFVSDVSSPITIFCYVRYILAQLSFSNVWRYFKIVTVLSSVYPTTNVMFCPVYII